MAVACYWRSLAMLEVFIWLRRRCLNRDEIPPGTLYLLILKTLARHVELPGYEIAYSIERTSDGLRQVQEGSLYPALQRMLLKGGGTAEWGTSAGNGRARYYKL